MADDELRLHFEQARQALRRGNPADAVAILNAAILNAAILNAAILNVAISNAGGSALTDDPRFRSRLTYAREWVAAEAGRRRAGDLTKLSHPELQSVLAWLCADEAEQARRASRAGDFPAAAEHWHRALRIDRRYTRAALSRAQAIHEACGAERRPPTTRTLAASWSATVGQLATAEQLAGRARDDRALAGEATRLLDRIRAERERAIKLAAFWRCFARLEGSGLARLEGFARLEGLDEHGRAAAAGELDRLLCLYGRDDPDIGPLLGDLARLVEAARAAHH